MAFPAEFIFLCGAHMDQISTLFALPKMGVSNPARVEVYPGGAALNTASVAARLGLDATLLSPIGNDAFGEQLVKVCHERGIKPRLIKDNAHPTGIYSAIFEPNGDILIGAADLEIYKTVNLSWIEKHLARCKGLFLTANLEPDVLNRAVDQAEFAVAATISPAKAVRFQNILDRIDLLFTNTREAEALSGISATEKLEQAYWFIHQGVASGTISDGERDLTCWNDGECFQLSVHPIPANKPIGDVNGAGDALAGGVLAGLGRGMAFEKAVQLGLASAAFSLTHKGPYSQALSLNILKDLS